MKKLFLILPLAALLFATQGWAPPPGKGGATGGPDISKCDLKPKDQTKLKLKDKSGKIHYICTGVAICGGKATPVSCKVSERESCPTAKVCIGSPVHNILKDSPIKYNIPKAYQSIKFCKDAKQSLEPFPDIKREEFIPITVVEAQPKILSAPSGINNYTPPKHELGKAQEVTSSVYKANTFFKPAGKLKMCEKFNFEPNEWHDCSASVIKIGKKMALVTAAHCVFNYRAEKKPYLFYYDLHFIPGLGLESSEKKFFVTSIIIPWGFRQLGPGYHNYDIAILELAQEPRENCCFGLINTAMTTPGIQIGYPVAPPFSDKEKKMYYLSIEKFLEESVIPSDMTQGSSGGPWVGNFQKKGNYGYISGINSRKSELDKKKVMRSPGRWDVIENLFLCSKGEMDCEIINLPTK
ncbi:MAG: hypothetical protein DRQ88_00010 [Epsilonproteobacteria bacterium]|nr:MAG: hypothetical protein DRQ88_00010 [Campylobacterota bacterium]